MCKQAFGEDNSLMQNTAVLQNMAVIDSHETFPSKTYRNISILPDLYAALLFLWNNTKLLTTIIKVVHCEMIPVDGIKYFSAVLCKEKTKCLSKASQSQTPMHGKLYFLGISPTSYHHFSECPKQNVHNMQHL